MTREETKALYIEMAEKVPSGKHWFFRYVKKQIAKKNAAGNYKLIAEIIEECYEQEMYIAGEMTRSSSFDVRH